MMRVLLGGDFRYFWPENISDFIHFPSAWDSILNTGVGKPALESLWITSYLNFTALFSRFGLSWDTIGILFFFFPAVFLSFFSSYYLFQKVFNKGRMFSFLSGVIYLTNTYALLILGGGQMGVILGYSLTPLVFYSFIHLIGLKNFRQALIFSLIFSLQILWDLRVAVVTSLGLLAYLIFKTLVEQKIITKKLLKSLTLSLLLTALLHFFWILPILLTGKSGLAHNQENFFNLDALKFFSFADFSNSFSLLHPNWPENIFGKVYFMRAEFLILPLIAYIGLLYLNQAKNDKNKFVLFFSLIGMVGAFLAKGVNPPFGQVYLWLFENFPGFFMFRDPTKFYLLVSLSYTVLIPFALSTFTSALEKIKNKKLVYAPVVLFTIVWLVLLKPLWLGETKFIKVKPLPEDYVYFKNFIVNDSRFFRTFWIPKWQRFGYFDKNHPAIDAQRFLDKDENEIINWLKNEDNKENLLRLGVQYIVVPYDSEGEIFLEDRKYSEKKYENVVKELSEISWLGKTAAINTDKLVIFKILQTANDRFWIENDKGVVNADAEIRWFSAHPAKYKIEIENSAKSGNLIFAESFDNGWVLIDDQEKINLRKTKDNLNSFLINNLENNSFIVYYSPQKYVNIGLVISLAALVFVIISLIRLREPRKK